MYNLGYSFKQVYSHKTKTQERKDFIVSYEQKPEDLMAKCILDTIDVSNKIIVSLETFEPNPHKLGNNNRLSKQPLITGALVPWTQDKLIFCYEKSHSTWFKLYRNNKLLALLFNDKEKHKYTLDEYIKKYKEDKKFVSLSKEDLLKLINYYIKGQSQSLYLEDVKEENLIILTKLSYA